MWGEFLENRIRIYEEKKAPDLQNWKKLWALVNFSSTVEDFKEWEALEFIIRFYMKGFLWEEQERLLDRFLEHYQIDYTKWAVKDAWVKMQTINGLKRPLRGNQMELPFFDLDKKRIEDRAKRSLSSKLIPYKLYLREKDDRRY